MSEVYPELAFDLSVFAQEVKGGMHIAPEDRAPTYADLLATEGPRLNEVIAGIRDNLREAHEAGKTVMLVIGNGGTFQSAETDHGLAPSGSLRESFEALNLPKDESVHLELIDLVNLDSSQMTVDHWRFLAEATVALEEEAGDLFDVVIDTHGTDTMTLGASYMSFMLQGFPKSIIMTGSQYPARQTGTDAKDQMERAIMTGKLAANPNRRITEVMVCCGTKISRAVWATKRGDKTTNAFEPWNQPNQEFDATEWAKAAANGTLDRLAPALLDFGTGKNTGSLEFAGHAMSFEQKPHYRPFTEITHPSNIIPARLTDIDPEEFAAFMKLKDVSVFTQLGSGTAKNELVEILLAGANHGKAVVLEAPFADSVIEAGTYVAGAGVTRLLPNIKRPLPIINTSPDAFRAKINFLMHSLKIEPEAVALSGLGTIYSSHDLRRFYDAMETNMVGELV